MKIKLAVSDERLPELTEALTRAGFELDDAADLVILERDRWISHLAVRDAAGSRVHLAVEDVVFLESFGHTVTVHCLDGTYQTSDRLYQVLTGEIPAFNEEIKYLEPFW